MAKKIVKTIKSGKPIVKEKEKVEYVVAPQDAFDYSSNLIPFLNSTSSTRAAISSKMIRQALPLKYREAPLVKTLDVDDTTFTKKVAEPFVAKSPVNGTVQNITKDFILIKGNDKKEYKVPLYFNFPLGSSSFIEHDVIVKVGDKVKKGQVLADTNFTQKGELALGTHLLTGYIPHKYTYEDGIVISEEAAKKLTSEHLHKRVIPIKQDDILDISKVLTLYPEAVTSDQRAKLDMNGIIRKGTMVNPGDVLAVYLTRRPIIKEDMWLKNLNQALAKPYEKVIVTWDGEDPGVVTDVVRAGSDLTIYIRTEEPAKPGDKLTTLHGNKGVITAILPTNEMPKLKDGKPLDILISPLSIPTRQNPSQIMSGLAAKAAQKIKQPIEIKNFDTYDNIKAVKKLIKKTKVSDKEEVLDPHDKPLGKVVVQPQYFLKLDHPARKKFSARYQGEYTIDRTPAKAKGESAQSLDTLTMFSMMGHGAPNILQEMATYKAERNPELWRKVQLGEPLPPPKEPFVWEKFVALLKGLGADVKKEGTTMQLIPLTDEHILQQSHGEIKTPNIIRAKDLKEIPGGLMDPKITGGKEGGGWAHIRIADPTGLPNPIYQRAILSLTGLKPKEYEGLLSGELEFKDGKIVKRQEKEQKKKSYRGRK